MFKNNFYQILQPSIQNQIAAFSLEHFYKKVRFSLMMTFLTFKVQIDLSKKF